METTIQHLKQSQGFLNLLLDNLVSAVFLVDKDVKIKAVNNSFSTLFFNDGVSPVGQLCGNGIGCVYTVKEQKQCGNTSFCNKCDLRKSLLGSFLEKVPTHKEKIDREFSIDGKLVFKNLQYTTRPIKYQDEDMVVVIIDDITKTETLQLEMKEKNERLSVLNEQKNEFLGIAAHDLRNPIGALTMFFPILKDAVKSGNIEKALEYMDIMNNSAKFSLNLLNELLDISAIESGKLDLHKELVNIVELIEKNVKVHHFVAARKEISIESNIQVDEAFKECSVDTKKIEQVLNNLISNAIKYSEKGTSILVNVKNEDKALRIEVIDHGKGIPEDELGKLFLKYQTTSTKSTAGEKSTGLGLAITKKIVEGHKGEVGVQSKVGEGSTFFFTLPAVG